MNDTAIKNFCIWARNELRQQVAQQALRYGITEDGYGDANAEIIGGRILTSEEKRERANLIQAYLGKVDESYLDRYNALIERAAYTWFNRFAAIRFMEMNGRLFSRVRMFSDPAGNFAPQVLKEALEVQIEGVDRAKVADLLDVGDDEALFRYLFLAQCDELASCMPEVFDPIGSALELLLPQNLLRNGSVIERMVADIPEEDWQEGVQIVGWMYQYYNAERKTEVDLAVKKGKKVSSADLPPKTALYTPDWIVRYLVENSLGRLWMRSHPASHLVDQMPYYIPDSDEVAISADTALSPESITLVDPACGSGHILVYAFELFGRIYEETGYTRRDIPQLVLNKNLSGIEIDPRAAQWAAFALYMSACEYDTRFLRRGVQPQITTLELVAFEDEEFALLPSLADHTKLLDAMGHMNECGSLFAPTEDDLAAIDDALESLKASDGLFVDSAREKLERMRKNCQPLGCTYDVIVANPPYLGSSNMDKWLANWTKKNYPVSNKDLCTCFIERCLVFSGSAGYAGLATSNSWMFISSYEKLRNKIVSEHTIETLTQLSVHGFKGIAAQICAFVLQAQKIAGIKGGYVRLHDFDHHSFQEEKTLEAIAHPDCGWFYRRAADAFSAIPGTPIAYWASDAMLRAFENGIQLGDIAQPKQGMVTRDNLRFLRMWHEVSYGKSEFKSPNRKHARSCGKKWFPCTTGGQFRKWYGNNEDVVNWENDGEELIKFSGSHIKNREFYFREALTWTAVSSASFSLRWISSSFIPEHAGNCFYGESNVLQMLLGLCNSTLCASMMSLLSPTLNFNVGDIVKIPVLKTSTTCKNGIESAVVSLRSLSKSDWDSFETSWDFERHPMV